MSLNQVCENIRDQIKVQRPREAAPTTTTVKNWLEKCGFVDVRIADVCVTTTEEQRRTEWMVTESLADFLDPNDHSKTVEGYPAPLRAVLIARKP